MSHWAPRSAGDTTPRSAITGSRLAPPAASWFAAIFHLSVCGRCLRLQAFERGRVRLDLLLLHHDALHHRVVALFFCTRSPGPSGTGTHFGGREPIIDVLELAEGVFAIGLLACRLATCRTKSISTDHKQAVISLLKLFRYYAV